MTNFDDRLSDFLTNLETSILNEHRESNRVYRDLSNKIVEQSMRLSSLISDDRFNDFVDSLYAIEKFELGYCYLCGIRDSNSPKDFNAVGEDILKELARNKTYIQLRLVYEERRNALQTILQGEQYALLADYINTKRMILDLEKVQCFSGAKRDKKQIEEYLNPANEEMWEKLVGLVCAGHNAVNESPAN